MGFNPSTYRLNQHPAVLKVLDSAIENSEVFVPATSRPIAYSLYWKFIRYRRAHETQAAEWAQRGGDGSLAGKYAWLKFKVEKRKRGDQEVWGVLISDTATDSEEFSVLDPDTMDPICK